MRKQTLQNLLTILFWGSVWGIVEATVGWLIHFLHLRGGALILYSFGMVCMLMSSVQTRKGTKAVLGTAVVAAVIKLADLLMPYTFRGALHPAAYIILEGVIVAAIASIFNFSLKRQWQPSKIQYRLAFPMFAVAAVLTMFLG